MGRLAPELTLFKQYLNSTLLLKDSATFLAPFVLINRIIHSFIINWSLGSYYGPGVVPDGRDKSEHDSHGPTSGSVLLKTAVERRRGHETHKHLSTKSAAATQLQRRRAKRMSNIESDLVSGAKGGFSEDI